MRYNEPPTNREMETPTPSPLVEDILGTLEDAGVPTEVNDQVVKLIEDWESSVEEVGTDVPPKALETETVEIEYSDGSKGSFEYPKNPAIANEEVGKALDSLLGRFLEDIDKKEGGAG